MDRFRTAGNPDSPVDSIEQLRFMCEAHSMRTAVSPVPDGHPDWKLSDGRLRHARADYFNIGLFEQVPGAPLFMMEQKEKALVMLLFAEHQGVPAVLLNLRTEPGLIGLSNLSTTIQSTPSNYLRKHGGRATPFMDIAADPDSFGHVVYDGEHHDWGDFYVRKTKRFLIVNLDCAVGAPPGFSWITLQTARGLLLEDHVITNDLRVSLVLLLELFDESRPQVAEQAPAETDDPLRSVPFDPEITDSRGTSVSFFKTETETREVTSWVQPLLVPSEDRHIQLISARRHGETVYGVEHRTSPGLSGKKLWFPTEVIPGRTVRHISTSAEGGRFWRYRIDIAEKEALSENQLDDVVSQNIEWLTREQVSGLVLTPRSTSLDLRMAWSLVLGER